ncbi:MAG TPA: hypothetical protein VNN77_07870 [candidate division Zixibacteria bacterium]|nr:hypothetical protein [candidate division Zixibacteria bacterium]
MAIRFPLMALSGLLLLVGVWAGLVRLGWELPRPFADFSDNHGPLMIVGFLGTLICLERAVALKRQWPYGAPILSALAAAGALLGLPAQAAAAAATLGSLFLVAVFVFLYRRQPAPHIALMGAGASLWLGGNLAWYFQYPLNHVVPWWAGFLAVTIAGERLELSRLLRLSTWDRMKLLLASGVLIFGPFVSLRDPLLGARVAGVGLFGLALWLLRYDLAWRTARLHGLGRFMGISLLSGYVWLAAAGLLWIGLHDSFVAGPRYDAMLHAVFVGFVFSMIFAHAPIIFPSVTGLQMPFQQLFYGHLALLHLSLLLRLAGDLLELAALQRWGGLLNAAAILLFLANNARAVSRGRSLSSTADSQI